MDIHSDKIFVSIITPTFNRGQFLEECMVSIKNQDYPFIEHIIIDSASTDNTPAIIKKYEGIYNLTWICEKDKGYANALNKGFAMAKGNIVCWLDSDDAYLPGTIKKIAEIFAKKPDIDVVFGDILISRDHGRVIEKRKHTDFDLEALQYFGVVDFSPQATFWRSSLHKKLGQLNEKYLRDADYDFFIRMGLSGAKFHHIRNFLAMYRSHPEQLTNSLDLCIAEGKAVLREHVDKNFSRYFLRKKRVKMLLRRAFQFIKQGDIWYVCRGALRRLGVLPSR